MNSIELKAIETKKPVIGFNHAEIRAELIRLTEQYKGLVVTQETLKSCKTTQRELASLRKKIDTYRKDTKREIKKPIDAFEDLCKDLISVVLEVENPIKESLVVFEEKRKKNQQLWVDAIVAEMVEKYQLGEEYSCRITTEERFLNATISEQEVVYNIESQARELGLIRDATVDRIKLIRTHLETVSKDLITPLTITDFPWIEREIETLSFDDAIKDINERAEKRKQAEQKAQEVKVEPKEEVVGVGIPPQAKPVVETFVQLYTHKIVFKGTKRDLEGVLNYLAHNNLSLGMVNSE